MSSGCDGNSRDAEGSAEKSFGSDFETTGFATTPSSGDNCTKKSSAVPGVDLPTAAPTDTCTRKSSAVHCGADFEAAISATGFGQFNFLLLATAVASVLTTNFEMTGLTFAFPAAQCDLQLSIEDKGFINATIYAGMIASSFIWGPLIDLFGRKPVLVVGHFLLIGCVLAVMFSTDFTALLVAKFFGGFIITAPCAALSPYLLEFHGKNYRSRIQLSIGLFYSISNLILPLLAWSILPLEIRFPIHVGLEFHSWNVFLLICGIPAVIAGVCFCYMPESPKFLMTKGENEGAMEVFRKIYSHNTGNGEDEYPVLKLIEEDDIKFSENRFKQAWKQIAPLFSAKHAYKLFLICFMQELLLTCLNSLRMWFPQFFQEMSNLETDADFCSVLSSLVENTEVEKYDCSVNLNSSLFLNTVIIGVASTVSYITATFAINKFGKKKLLLVLGFCSSTFYYCLYFSHGTLTLIMICGYNMTGCVFVDVLISATIDLFPTSLRASAFALAQMCGRIGSLTGNLAFPFLVHSGCEAPVFTFGSMLAACTLLSLLLPNTDMKSLV